MQSHIRGMLEAGSSDLELHLFLDDRTKGAPPPFEDPRVHAHYVWGRVNALANVLNVTHCADEIGLDAVVYHNYVPYRADHARIAFVHDVSFREHPRFFTRVERMYFAPMRWLVPSADRIATPSASEKARLIRYGYGRDDQIDAVPHGVDPAFRPRSGWSEEALRAALRRFALPAEFILFVGRLNVRKNIATLISALPKMASRLPLVIAGAPDWKTSDLPAEAARLGVADRVHFLGGVSQEELEALYASATVFCFPSFDEGFGLPPLEAMASGCPVVSSNAASLPEVCGDACLLVDPHDAPGFAAALDAVIRDGALRERMRAAGLARAGALTLARCGASLLDVVERAVAGRTAA
ncbi:MAG TPA: glycosyltransferase family 1 protein [Gemmatimonadaceae bacterium]|nr:glycosyltransferase family 1 protein [Gemmatimonadaceae bacterium]